MEYDGIEVSEEPDRWPGHLIHCEMAHIHAQQARVDHTGMDFILCPATEKAGSGRKRPVYSLSLEGEQAATDNQCWAPTAAKCTPSPRVINNKTSSDQSSPQGDGPEAVEKYDEFPWHRGDWACTEEYVALGKTREDWKIWGR